MRSRRTRSHNFFLGNKLCIRLFHHQDGLAQTTVRAAKRCSLLLRCSVVRVDRLRHSSSRSSVFYLRVRPHLWIFILLCFGCLARRVRRCLSGHRSIGGYLSKWLAFFGNAKLNRHRSSCAVSVFYYDLKIKHGYLAMLLFCILDLLEKGN